MRRTTSTDARKKDTREKIELGGLIVKAGLRYEIHRYKIEGRDYARNSPTLMAKWTM